MEIRRAMFRAGDRWEWGVYVPSKDALHLYPTEGLQRMAAANLKLARVRFELRPGQPRGTQDDIEFSS